MIGCTREKRRRRGESKDDLRARQDFFNFSIWLDESASEWVLPRQAKTSKLGGCVSSVWKDGWRGVRLRGGVSLQEFHKVGRKIYGILTANLQGVFQVGQTGPKKAL